VITKRVIASRPIYDAINSSVDSNLLAKDITTTIAITTIDSNDNQGPPPEPDEPDFGEFVLDNEGIPTNGNQPAFEFDARPAPHEPDPLSTIVSSSSSSHQSTSLSNVESMVEFYSDEEEEQDLESMVAALSNEQPVLIVNNNDNNDNNNDEDNVDNYKTKHWFYPT
jgi:hypothetical protein